MVDIALDVAFWEGVPAWDRVFPRPLYVVAKATQGETILDTSFIHNWFGLKANKIIRAAYHYITLGNPVHQGQLFADVIEDNGYSSSDTFWMDFEIQGYSERELRYCLDTFESKTGLTPGIYTRKDIWQTICKGGKTPPAWTKKYRLWIAYYPTTFIPGMKFPKSFMPLGFNEISMWQFSDKEVFEGISGRVDVNYLYPEFKSHLLSINPDIANEPEPEVIGFKGKVIAYRGLRVREDPKVVPSEANVITVLPYNTLVYGESIKVVSPGEEWMKITSPRVGWIATRYESQKYVTYNSVSSKLRVGA